MNDPLRLSPKQLRNDKPLISLNFSVGHEYPVVRVLLDMSYPELTFPAAEADHLRKAYEAAQIILEYGSGGSTTVGAQMSGKLIFSVESDRNWAIDLQRHIDESGFPSPAIIYYVDIGPTGAWGRPKNPAEWQKFHRYPMAIWDEPFFRHPDLVLIDGRFRSACFATVCLRITRPVTVLFDDYQNRPKYHKVEAFARPARIIGRMAEFHLEPGMIDQSQLAGIMALFTEATYADSKVRYGDEA